MNISGISPAYAYTSMMKKRQTGRGRNISSLSCTLASGAERQKDDEGLKFSNVWKFTCIFLRQSITCYTENPDVAKLINRLNSEKEDSRIALTGKIFAGGPEWAKHPLYIETIAGLKD